MWAAQASTTSEQSLIRTTSGDPEIFNSGSSVNGISISRYVDNLQFGRKDEVADP